MNKENETPRRRTESEADGDILTPEQRARMSLNFRTAKALLARKKPRLSTPLPSLPLRALDKPNSAHSVPVPTRERIPLKDLQLNAGCQSVSRGSYREDVKYIKASPTICNSVDSRTTRYSDGHCKDESFVTPMNTGGRLFDPIDTNQCFIVPSVLDEDFDNTILEEIDSLCTGSGVKSLPREVNSGPDCTRKTETNDDSFSTMKLFPHVELENRRCDLEDSSPSHTERVNIIGAKEFPGMSETSSKFMVSLNEDQLEAASTDALKPLMVVAGPGSGKTSTMVGRVLMLLNQDIDPSNILAMTFTTAAASEMRERIATVAGKEIAKTLTISTFHSFSLQLCRKHADKLGRTQEFLIYGHGQQRRAVVEAVRLLDCERDVQQLDASETGGLLNDIKINECKEKSQKWQKFVTQAKASGKTPEECRQNGDELGAKILSNYNNILRSCNALDYHDLISCSVKLLADVPEVFNECQELWKAIIVDEFQDTSAMQYSLLRLLASHGQITVVGDDDQSIFSFNGANICGFDFFRRDFPNHKEVRLRRNYRSTRCIVEAAASLIQHNMKRCKSKQVLTDNLSGSKITLKECYNEDAQCAYVVDKILETVRDSSETKSSFGNIAILYRRQVSGRAFQATFRDRKIPFNVHGVAFYRKKVIKAIMAMLKTTIPGCDDNSYRQVFKTFLPYEKEERKRVIEHIDKVSTIRKSTFISAASDIFNAKISGTFKRSQLSQGRKVLVTLEMISKLVSREQSISSVVTSIANLIPQKYLLEQRAVINCDGVKLLNEDNDLRSVLEYLLDDVTDFLSSQSVSRQTDGDIISEDRGCAQLLKVFVDYISEREKENFRSRRHDNEDSVTLTTIHQSKGLEWDIVFIVKANESEIPLLHEHNGITKERGNSIEEERRLFYVAMTRARKKLFISHVMMDSHWQMLHPSRFVREIPTHLLEVQGDMNPSGDKTPPLKVLSEDATAKETSVGCNSADNKVDEASEELREIEFHSGNTFLKRFDVEDRGLVSRIFHQWAKKKAFQNPKRLLDKISFVIDERLRTKKGSSKDSFVSLKSSLKCDEALWFAEYVIKWEQIPADKRLHLMREKQEHFQKLRMENAMGSSTPTSKQIGYLHSLGCTVVPESKLHASRLIEQYKSL
ncbi:hypothetical protein vseg_020857 [Gypsophila vaccaria]